jgi:hypothetical protein
MNKTYSVATQRKDEIWVTNWYKYFSLDEIAWSDVEEFCKEHGHIAYGYYYGTNSNALTSARCRTVVKTF